MTENPYQAPSDSPHEAELVAELQETASLSFETSAEDIVAFNDYYYQRSSRLQRRVTSALRLVFLAVITLAALVLGIAGQAYDVVFILLVVSLPVIFLLPWFHRRLTTWTVRKIIAEGKNVAFAGVMTVSVTNEGVESETDYVRSLHKWPAIEKIAETAAYGFFFTAGFAAIIVPKRACQSEPEWRSFIQAARRRAPSILYVDDRQLK